ncbi:carbohydrate-binding module family 14 protein [Streptomyces sp. NPDC014870]|uniref:carbohydrate-binding module family 14 protein n=1 Tax=Streptomyces sp. NPDC014870 TaxID=3364925 RepID=UPI0036F6786F
MKKIVTAAALVLAAVAFGAPVPAQAADFKCPTPSGLFPNPENPRGFYHCSNGYAYAKECPANLHFNPTLLVCDWPEHAGAVTPEDD